MKNLPAAVLSFLIALFLPVPTLATENPSDLSRLSLEELGNVRVTSVSKAADLLRQAPAAIFVITREDIQRSGVTSISEALRLAPNLQVSQLSSSSYVVAARGFGGNPDAQNFSNKMLILIDGRSVYSPLYSGVYLDAQDTFIDDIDRIEVISGPGATMWGANAMNGVINIITRPTYLTNGSVVGLGAGNKEQYVGGRFGGQTSEGVAYRFYGKAFHRGAMELASGMSSEDGWDKVQGGFRADWSRLANSFTVQGDTYRGTQNQLTLKDQRILGANALMRWEHAADASDLRLQLYFDQTQRAAPEGGVAFVLHTYDLELQQSIALAPTHRIVWGAGGRINSYGITNSEPLAFIPPKRNLYLANLFAQDTFAIGDFKFTFGLKLEKDPYADWELLPDVRAAWELNRNAMIWIAGSRAIRSPTPFDRDVVERLGGITFLTGNPAFQPETVSAYEMGFRGQPHKQLSLSASIFFNVYDDLRTVELGPTILPLRWDNLMQGDAYGFEAWATWQVTNAWRLSPGVRTLEKRLQFKPGASALIGLEQAGNDPDIQALLTSSLDVTNSVVFDAQLRYQGELPAPQLKHYFEVNARLGWQVSPTFEVSLTGQNLLHDKHTEAPSGHEIVRSFLAQATWTW